MADELADLATHVVEVEQLPDGRRLVVFGDRREVVVGVALPRAHPVPGWEWLGPHPPAPRTRPRHPPTARPRRPIRVLPDDRASLVARGRSPWRTRPGADARAEALLCSLLDPLQRADWDTHGGFWVETPRGPVRLGHLYALVHRPHVLPKREDVLCVVPDAHHELPIADIWSNLLLVLAVEPDEFFRVAIFRGSRPLDSF